MPNPIRVSQDILADVESIVSPFGLCAVELLQDAVGVKGDSRAYGPTVVIKALAFLNHDRLAEVSVLITNQVPEITRVLVDCMIPNPP
jgi:GMP synthase PP-ATPase subunit